MFHFSLDDLQEYITLNGYNINEWISTLRENLKRDNKLIFLKVLFLNNLRLPKELNMMLGGSIVVMMMMSLTSYWNYNFGLTGSFGEFIITSHVSSG